MPRIPHVTKPHSPILQWAGAVVALSITVNGGAAQSGTSPTKDKSAGQGEKPNVLIILTDDEGYGDLKSFFPATGFDSPHFDRLAAEGTRFSDFYVGSAVCSPSRAALITGRTSFRTCRSWKASGSSPITPIRAS